MEKSITFKELSQRWLSVSSLGKTYTYQQNLQSYINHLNNGIGECKVTDVKPAHIDEIIRRLYIENPNTKKPTSKKVLKNIVDCATRIFDYAIENELIYKNPAKNKKKVIPKNAPTKIVGAITPEQQQLVIDTEHRAKIAAVIMMFMGLRTGDDDDKIRLNQRKPSKYKGLSRFGPEKNLQRINKFMKERPIFYKNLIQMKENFRFYLRCFYCITKVVILQFNSENRTELARNG